MEQYKINDADLWAYISKVTNTQTQANVEHWINSDDYDEALFNKINNLYRITGESPYERDIDIKVEKHKFFKTIKAQSTNEKNWKHLFKYAAVIALIITSASISIALKTAAVSVVK